MTTLVMRGAGMASYGFGPDHPFGTDRHDAFHRRLDSAGLDVCYSDAAPAEYAHLKSFHTQEHIDGVAHRSAQGRGSLDGGDTPVVPGIYEAACHVVGAAIAASEAVIRGDHSNAFVPIGGLHHARRDRAAGFCVFNDCGIVIEHLRSQHQVHRIAYIDIDAHHGDGVFYGFEDDPDVLFADLHEDGRYLYPGTGSAEETGCGEARGTKLNIPLLPGADDSVFADHWKTVEAYLREQQPEFILLQCGADSLAGDPITHLALTERSHALAARKLRAIAEEFCRGRVVAFGGGGYNRTNLATAWTAVVAELSKPSIET